MEIDYLVRIDTVYREALTLIREHLKSNIRCKLDKQFFLVMYFHNIYIEKQVEEVCNL